MFGTNWHGVQQDLPAAGARAPLAGVLGLGRQESLTPAARDVHLAGATRQPSADKMTQIGFPATNLNEASFYLR